MKIAGAVILVLLSAALSGCWSFRKKAPKALPPLTAPVIVAPVPTPPVDIPPEATTPIELEPAPPPPEVTIIKPDLQPPPEQQPVKAEPKPAARRPATAPPAVVPTPPASPATEAPGAPTPQLAELISEERRLELHNEIEQSLDRARAALDIASRRSLTRRQTETVKRVRTFIRQADDAKSRDISTAVQLARRADLLAQDLTATFGERN